MTAGGEPAEEPRREAGVRAWLHPPPGDGSDASRRAALLYRVLVAAYPILLLLTIAAFFGSSRTARITYPLQCVVVAVVLVLLRHGRSSVAMALALASIWGLSTLTVIEEGGAGSAAMGSYALTVLMAGFFWSFGGALAVAGATAVATAVLVWSPSTLGLPPFTRADPTRYFAETMGQVVVTAVVLQFALAFIRQAAEAKHRAELAANEAKLDLERRTREAQKFEAIGRLAGGVAHDLNNLFTVILAELDLARVSPGRRDLDGVKDAARRASRLAGELLAVGRAQELAPEPLELNALIRELEPVLRKVAGPSSHFALSLRPGSLRVSADPGQLERVLVNLVANARDATGGLGPIRIESGREGPTARLTVADEGDGMSDEVQARLFEPFFSTKGERGTGLGLATAHGVVAQSGGWLRVESRVGRGTRMHVHLPLAEAP